MDKNIVNVMSSDAKSKRRYSKIYPVIFLALIGVILLILGSMGDSGKASSESEEYFTRYDGVEYEKELTQKIEELCSSVKGAGKVRVAVTLDGSFKAIYAQDGTKNEYLLLGSGSNEKALLIGYAPPRILGVGIVCEGASDKGVKAEIVSLVSAFLDLPTNKIYVARLKN